MTLANSNTSTNQQGKYFNFDNAYIQQDLVEKFQLGLLPVMSSSSRLLHREGHNYILVTWHDSRVNGQWSQGIRSELVLLLADDLASLDA